MAESAKNWKLLNLFSTGSQLKPDKPKSIAELSANILVADDTPANLQVLAGEFRYVSAGHPGPVHLPSGADPVILESQGFPIGNADNAYEERSACLGAGDRLYLYFDGVPEAMDFAGKQFGTDRLLTEIGKVRSRKLHEGIVILLEEITRWHESEGPQDDISILSVEISGEPECNAAGESYSESRRSSP